MSEEARAERSSSIDRVAPTDATSKGGTAPVEDARSSSVVGAPAHSKGSQGQEPGSDRRGLSNGRREAQRLLRHVTHEIRTPITAMTGLAGELLEGDLDVKQRETLETVRDSGEYVLSLVADILDLSRAASGRLSLDEEPTDLDATIEAALGLVGQQAGEKGVSLVHAFHDDVPHEIYADGDHLKQVLVNLLSNAVKATEGGEVGIYVDRPSPASNGNGSRDMLRFSVRDTGVGIPEEALDGLFEPFSRVAGGNGSGGTGLGLAICNELVALMGGSIDVDSTVGEGTTFRFTIQTKPAHVGVSS